MGPADLYEVMRTIPVPKREGVIVGINDADDAGVVCVSGEIALVQTLDFITPIVDDPFMFGRIAAVNSLSDVYAMGGKPLTAMNIVCFPSSLFPLDTLSEILKGGLSAIEEAEAALVGGHTVDDKELKYGLSVTGIVHPDKIIRNSGLKVGDALVLTKPLGTGIIATALKAGMAKPSSVEAFQNSMASLNNKAAEIMFRFAVHACTDVTGFGLAGHVREMIGKDGVEVEIDAATLPTLPGAIEYASMGLNPAGLYRNRDYIGNMIAIAGEVRQEYADIVFDPQTSGGLLIALEKSAAKELVASFHQANISSAVIIATVKKGDGIIRLV